MTAVEGSISLNAGSGWRQNWYGGHGDLDVTGLDAGQSVSLNANQGSLTANSVTAMDGYISASSTLGATLRGASATNSVYLTAAEGALEAERVSSGGNLSLTASKGGILAENLAAVGNLTLTGSTGFIHADKLTSIDGSVTITGGNEWSGGTASIDASNIKAKQSVTMTTYEGNLTAKAVTAVEGSISLNAGSGWRQNWYGGHGDLDVTGLDAGQSVSLNANQGSLTANSVTAMDGYISASSTLGATLRGASATNSVYLTVVQGDLMTEDVETKTNINWSTPLADFVLAEVASSIRLSTTQGDIRAVRVTSGGDLTLEAGTAWTGSPGNISGTTLQARRDITATTYRSFHNLGYIRSRRCSLILQRWKNDLTSDGCFPILRIAREVVRRSSSLLVAL